MQTSIFSLGASQGYNWITDYVKMALILIIVQYGLHDCFGNYLRMLAENRFYRNEICCRNSLTEVCGAHSLKIFLLLLPFSNCVHFP